MSDQIDRLAKGRALEQRIAELFAQNGYSVEQNVVREGKNGARHELDVLARRSDALTTTVTAVECKAWSGPIDKEVVAKLAHVLRELGINHGVVASLRGWTIGAEGAARETGIELWGPDELAQRLGRAVVDGLGSAPVVAARGFPASVDPEQGLRLVQKQGSRGVLGMGRKGVASLGLLWTPWHLVKLATTSDKGRRRRRTVSQTSWLLYDALEGIAISERVEDPTPEDVDISGASLDVERPFRQIESEITKTLTRYREVTTDAAKERHADRLAGLGVASPDSAIRFEEQSVVYRPLYVGVIETRDGSRVTAFHAHGQPRPATVAEVLTRRVSLVVAAIESNRHPLTPPPPPAP